MSYRVGPAEMKRAKDFIGRKSVMLRELVTRGGVKFAVNDAVEIRRVWKRRVNLRRISDGALISGVSGYDILIENT